MNCTKKLFFGYILFYVMRLRENIIIFKGLPTKLAGAEVFSVQFSLTKHQLKVFNSHFTKWTSITYLGRDLKNYSGNNFLNLDDELDTAALIRIQVQVTLSLVTTKDVSWHKKSNLSYHNALLCDIIIQRLWHFRYDFCFHVLTNSKSTILYPGMKYDLSTGTIIGRSKWGRYWKCQIFSIFICFFWGGATG